MIDDVITGISRTLDEKFNGAYRIYSEKIEQGLKSPCFIIDVVNTTSDPLLNARSKRTYNFDIVYISKSNTYAEMYSMAEKLFSALKWIILLDGTKLLAFEMRYEVVDNDLHFFVTYPSVMQEVEEKILMENYSLDNEIIK